MWLRRRGHRRSHAWPLDTWRTCGHADGTFERLRARRESSGRASTQMTGACPAPGDRFPAQGLGVPQTPRCSQTAARGAKSREPRPAGEFRDRTPRRDRRSASSLAAGGSPVQRVPRTQSTLRQLGSGPGRTIPGRSFRS